MGIEYNTTHLITGKIQTVTGLHIGAGRDVIEIGGVDNPVIKHVHTGEPYIPGSSLKGKLRCLLEWALDSIDKKGGVWGSVKHLEDPVNDRILRIFGTTHEEWKGGPARILVRDAHLEKEWRDRIVLAGLPLTEEKVEVRIDRIQGKAATGAIHRAERVPAGAKFDLEILFKEYSVDGDGGATDRECLNWLLAGLRLLEQDALGGSGSRGYGRVKFTNLELNGKDIQQKFDDIEKVGKDKPPVDFLAE